MQQFLRATPWDMQKKIIQAVRDYPQVAVRSCHDIGKSYIAGNLALWFLFSHQYSIVLTTAPTWRQVEKLIWKEIRSSIRKSPFYLGGELAKKAPELQVVQDEWVALGLSTNQPERFQGFHARHILVIVDEASGVKEEIYEAIQGVLSSGHTRLLLIGNPTLIGGTFYRAFHPGKNAGDWKLFHIAAWDTPNFTSYGITEEDLESGAWAEKVRKDKNGNYVWPYPSLITPEWAAKRLREWGKDHPAYQARVAGNFPTQGERNVIPLAWIEAAQARWEDVLGEGSTYLGVDVARYGDDLSAIAPRHGRKVLPLRTFAKLDTQELAGEVILAKSLLPKPPKAIKVDVIGIGAGVVDALKAAGEPVQEVNVGAGSTVEDRDGNKRFTRLRSELWWQLREELNPENPEPLGLPPDEELMADLAAPLYQVTGKGQIQVEEKDETKKRLGRSPDRGDAVMLSFAPDDVWEMPLLKFGGGDKKPAWK